MVIRNESDFYQKVLKKYFFNHKGIFHIRVENKLCRGTPDIWFSITDLSIAVPDGWIELKYENNPLSPAQKDFIDDCGQYARHWTFYWQKDKIKIVSRNEFYRYVVFSKDFFFFEVIDAMYMTNHGYGEKVISD